MDGLLAAKPIVKVDFFESWKAVLEKNPESSQPDFDSFVPPNAIPASMGCFENPYFLPNETRKTLFQGKTFVFPSKDLYDSMARNVEKAGGKATRDFVEDTDDTILVEATHPPFSEEYTSRLQAMRARGKRSVPLKEIVSAIISCSTMRYCNPSTPITARKEARGESVTLVGPRRRAYLKEDPPSQQSPSVTEKETQEIPESQETQLVPPSKKPRIESKIEVEV